MTARTEEIDHAPRAGWLELARRQSQAQAESFARAVGPFAWSTARPRSREPLLSPAWAVGALAVVLVGGVTLAFVSRPATQPAPARAAVAGDGARGEAPRAREPKAHARSEATNDNDSLEPAEDAGPVARVLARGPRRAKPAAAEAKDVRKPEEQETIILGPDDKDSGGEVIIVTPPPRKLKPLWTPEAFKKRGVGPRW